MLSTSGPRSKEEGADLGLPEQHKMSSLEHDDSSNRHAHNMLAYRWRKVDGHEREDVACSSFSMGAVAREGA